MPTGRFRRVQPFMFTTGGGNKAPVVNWATFKIDWRFEGPTKVHGTRIPI